MTPIGTRHEFRSRVLRIVNEQVDTTAEVNSFRVGTRAIHRLLMVADVGHADPADINPVAECFANMTDPPPMTPTHR